MLVWRWGWGWWRWGGELQAEEMLEMGKGGEVGGVAGEPGKGRASEVIGNPGETVRVIGDAVDEEELGEEEEKHDHVPRAIE